MALSNFTSNALFNVTKAVEPLVSGDKWDNLRDRFFNKAALITADKTPYKLVAEHAAYKLRYYAPANGVKAHKVPLLFVCPLAVNTFVYDLHPDKSVVNFFTQQGVAVYLIEWSAPTRRQQDDGFKEYICDYMHTIIGRVREHSGSQDVSLHGWSMGGIFALLYTAWQKDAHIKNLIIFASPINSYMAGGIAQLYPALSYVFKALKRTTGLHPTQLPRSMLYSTGRQNAISFKLVDPVGLIKGHINMFKKIENRDNVASHATIGAFLNDMTAYPGGILRDMMMQVWLENPLGKGYFDLAGQRVHLHDISSNLLAIAGRDDGIVGANALRPLGALINSSDASFFIIPGGHVGIMSSDYSAEHCWPQVVAWLKERS